MLNLHSQIWPPGLVLALLLDQFFPWSLLTFDHEVDSSEPCRWLSLSVGTVVVVRRGLSDWNGRSVRGPDVLLVRSRLV